MKDENIVIEATNLRKSYKDTLAVAELSLSIRAGECFALLGPNGAGKTSTCEMLEGLIEPDAGNLRICGLSYDSDRKAILEKIGVQQQETHLYKKYSVLETLQLFASFYKETEDIASLSFSMGLTDVLNRRLEALSGGQKQRVYLACALINKPRVLFLDEPSLGLDPSSRQELWRLLKEIKNRGCALFLTTHYMDEATELADRIAIMSKGHILKEGTQEYLMPTRDKSPRAGQDLEELFISLTKTRDSVYA